MKRIDLSEVLKEASSTTYNNLVTRATGQAIRGRIENELADGNRDQVAVIDFGAVGCLDFSCADEIVAKLLLNHGEARYFLLLGVSPAQREAIEAVLERHHLAVAAQDRSGSMQVLGPIPEVARKAFGFLVKAGSADESEVIEHLDMNLDTARAALNELCDRHLVQFSSPRYQALTTI